MRRRTTSPRSARKLQAATNPDKELRHLRLVGAEYAEAPAALFAGGIGRRRAGRADPDSEPLKPRMRNLRPRLLRAAGGQDRRGQVPALGLRVRGEARGDGRNAGGGHRQSADPQPDQHRRQVRVGRRLAAHADRLARSRPARAQAAISSSSAGCQGSSRSARPPSWRSAANVYWLRSLVPMLTGSRRAPASGAARSAAAGISIMTPTWAGRGARHASANSRGLGRGGDHRRHHPDLGGGRRRRPRRWRPAGSSRTSGRRRAIRRPRTPSAGFGSSGSAEERQRLVGAGVQGAHDDRACRANAPKTSRVGGDLLLDGRARRAGRGRGTRCATGRRLRRSDRRGPAAEPMLSSRATGWPSAVGPGRAAARPARRRPRRRVTSARRRRRRRATVPVGAVDRDQRCRRRRQRRRRTRRRPGCPSAAGQDRGVAGRAAALGDQRRGRCVGSSVAVSAGARSSATRTNGWPGIGDAGHRQPEARPRRRGRAGRRGPRPARRGSRRPRAEGPPGAVERLGERVRRRRCRRRCAARRSSASSGSSAIIAWASRMSRAPSRRWRSRRRARRPARRRRSSSARRRDGATLLGRASDDGRAAAAGERRRRAPSARRGARRREPGG